MTYAQIQDKIKQISKDLDACWCDDGRGLPECGKCLANREELHKYEELMKGVDMSEHT